jgi:hypothetical protein
VVAAGVLAVFAAWLRQRALAHLLSVENAAEATRLAVLRPIPPGAGGLESASAYLAADSTARVGGEFFDVQGKGTSAVDAAAALLAERPGMLKALRERFPGCLAAYLTKEDGE